MNKLCNGSAIAFTVLVLSLGGINFSVAQTTDPLPVCASVSLDPDGDGFGFVVPTVGRQSSQGSCVVTSQTATVPNYTNLETGQSVQLERAFWDGNADLVNRNIACRTYEWNESSSSYEEEALNWFRFFPLPSQAPWIGYYDSKINQADLNLTRGSLTWSVDTGILASNAHIFGPTEFPAGATHWVESVTLSSGVSALRFWNGSRDYNECIDSSGQTLQATGRSDQPATALPSPYIETPVFFTGTQEPQPAIINRKTGQQVQFATGTWELQSDLIFRTVACTPFSWNGNDSDYLTNSFFGVDILEYQARLVGDSANTGLRFDSFDGRRSVDTWTVAGNNMNVRLPFLNSMWYEPISTAEGVQGVRYWGNLGEAADVRNNGFFDCYASERPARGLWSSPGPVQNFRPQNDSEPSPGNVCLDPDGDGWGWNGVSSCQVATVSTPVSMTSDNCVDPDGDGWGWNGVSSCEVGGAIPASNNSSSSVCSDPDGDGWGWDGTSSCLVTDVVTTGGNCEDPDGDGWGWNGVSSCQVGAVDVPMSDSCDYSDADLFDGWGWDAVARQSCAPR